MATLSPLRTTPPTARQRPRVRPAAVVAAVVLALLVAFQVALAAGSPLGAAAWGGAHRVLPTSLRILTVVPIVVYVLGALVLLRVGGVNARRLSLKVAARATWVFTAVLTVSALANLASSSAWERYLMAPVALTLAVLAIVVARQR